MRLATRMRLLSLSTTLALLASLAVACAAPTIDDGDGDSGDAEDMKSTSSAATVGCAASKAKILASVTGARRTAIGRGFEWLEDNVPYSQSRFHEGYRTDCSGFVSMCWQLGSSPNTEAFSASSSQWKKLASYESLLPGDALVRRANGKGHIVLFLGWNDASHKGACVLEQASTASDMEFRVRTTSSMRGEGYKAIAATKLQGSGVVESGPDVDEPVIDEDEPNDVEAEPAGKACASDGACNPGNNGSGKICVGGRCVSGCKMDAQCPGITTCVSGQCR